MPKKKTGLDKVCCMMMGFLLLSCVAFAQRTVTGKVINKTDQQPVRNATVLVRGTVIAAQTDSSGDFSIVVPNNNNQLEISSVGYENAVVPIAGKTNLGPIQLTVTVGNLNEVFVTGYTSQKKKDITAEKLQKDEEFKKNLQQMSQRTGDVLQGLTTIGLESVVLNNEQLVELFYNFYNPGTIERESINLPK